MEKRSRRATRAVMVAALSLGVVGIATQSLAKSNCPVEKCYGIVKKTKNDCGTPKHACAAQSKVSGSKNEWMFVMKGNCDRIVGGSLKPATGAAPAATSTKK